VGHWHCMPYRVREREKPVTIIQSNFCTANLCYEIYKKAALDE
ncbi:21942_t:CDS:1, partial [Gigaspora margarita]